MSFALGIIAIGIAVMAITSALKRRARARDGVVHLQGTVSTGLDRAEAERLAKATKGVREVKNDLPVTAGAASPRTR